MSSRLVIWLPVIDGKGWHWYLSELHNGIAQTPSEKIALLNLDAKEVWAIVPGQWTRIVSLDLPKMRPQDRLAAAGFQIEDQLGAALTEQHIVLGEGERQCAAIISADKIKALQAEFTQLGLSVNAVFADYDVLQNLPAPIALDDRIIVPALASDDMGGFTLDVDIYNGLEKAEPARQGDLSELSQSLVDIGAINLLQGKYASRRFTLNNLLSLSRAAALLAVLGVSLLAWAGFGARAANLQAADIKAQTRDVYEIATGQSAPSNPALVVTRAIRSGGPVQADFLSLSALLFDAASQTPGITIENLQFDMAQNRLTLRLIYPSFETASELERQVKRLGGAFKAGGVREQGERLVGDAVLTLGGGA